MTQLVAAPAGEGLVTCGICGSGEVREIDFDFTMLRTESTHPAFHTFRNYICGTCGVVFIHPQPTESALVGHYNSDYRRSPYALTLGGRCIDTPVNFDQTIQSFQRFKNFYDVITRVAERTPDVVPRASDTILDVGGYQGAFLAAAEQAWGVKGAVFDYSTAGVDFARRAFGFTESTVVTDVTVDRPARRVRFVTSVHSFEHMRRPQDFLTHVRQHVLTPDGYLYLEVPSASGTPLSNPTHFFMFAPDSLRQLLGACGYDVLEIGYSGFPREQLLMGHPEENIVCLARPRSDGTKTSHAVLSADERYREIKADNRRLSFRALGRMGRDLARSVWTLLIQSLLIVFVDRLPARRARGARRAINYLDSAFRYLPAAVRKRLRLNAKANLPSRSAQSK